MTVALNAAPRPVCLIHGGLAEDIGADQFWVRPGIVAALEARGWTVVALDWNTTPTSWSKAAAEMTEFVGEASTVVAGSNGVSVALRMAIDQPRLVSKLVLLWPATAGDVAVDRMIPSSAAHLLAGETVRGVSDAELGGINVSVAVMVTDAPNPFHQYRTVERLVDLIPLAVRLDGGFPESSRPDFIGRLDEFMAVLVNYALGVPLRSGVGVTRTATLAQRSGGVVRPNTVQLGLHGCSLVGCPVLVGGSRSRIAG